MNGFDALRKISNTFHEDLRQASAELLIAKPTETLEEMISNKMRDITLFTSKLRLLKAKPLASTAEVVEQNKCNTINDYENAVLWNIMFSQGVKCTSQIHAVHNLIMTPNDRLDPIMLDRKMKIIKQLSKFKDVEMEAHCVIAVAKNKQNELAVLRSQWHSELCNMRDIRNKAEKRNDESDSDNPLYQKLCALVNKMELMRLIISKLITARTSNYDWLSDPSKISNALKVSRQVNTVEQFVRETD